MHVIHGTWIPREPAGFHQDGGFYLWVEGDRSVSHRQRAETIRLHPCHLSWATFGDFLAQKLHFRGEYGVDLEQWMVSKRFLLPSASGKPVPSREILPYLQDDPPDEWELSAWQICCYPLTDVIRGLRDLHFIASQEADDFQLGADIMFWHQFARELRAVIAADQYIPSIAVRSLGPDGDGFELTGRWELLSDGFDNDPARTTTLKRLVEPFILRRLKTDPTIIDDLPDKIEQKVYCNLTPEQASLYEIVVREVEGNLDEVEGIERRIR